jgi:hypothetical protein
MKGKNRKVRQHNPNMYNMLIRFVCCLTPALCIIFSSTNRPIPCRISIKKIRSNNYIRFLFVFRWVMEGLGCSGRLVGSISTYSGAYYIVPGVTSYAKNTGGWFVLPSTGPLQDPSV